MHSRTPEQPICIESMYNRIFSPVELSMLDSLVNDKHSKSPVSNQRRNEYLQKVIIGLYLSGYYVTDKKAEMSFSKLMRKIQGNYWFRCDGDQSILWVTISQKVNCLSFKSLRSIGTLDFLVMAPPTVKSGRFHQSIKVGASKSITIPPSWCDQSDANKLPAVLLHDALQ